MDSKLWTAEHVAMSETWWQPARHNLGQIVAEFPALRLLTLRTFDLLATSCVSLPEGPRRVLNLTKSAKRLTVHADTPHTHLWFTDKYRMLLGAEALHCQGVAYPDPHNLGRADNKLLPHLAGNAFHTGRLASTMLCTMVAMGVALLRKEVKIR